MADRMKEELAQTLSRPRAQFLLLVLIVLALLWFGTLFHFNDKPWIAFFHGIPFPVSATLFVLAYVAVTFFIWFAKDLLKVIGAVVFGPYWSTLFIWLAELANAVIFFHMSRRLGRAFIEEKFKIQKAHVEKAEKGGGVWHIFFLRTVPLIPYRFLDLAYGLTSVPFRRYVIVSAVAMPIRIFWLQFIAAGVGSAIFDQTEVMAYFEKNLLVLRLSFLYLVFSIAAAFFLSKKLK
jgi:uncharacterized membrane protein YdjX (TVP38/TMEM64 family)